MNVPTGFLPSKWWKLLKEVNFQVDRKYISRALQVSVLSILNSRYAVKEKQLFESEYNQVRIEKPIFILGHWRNGTTLLHELMAMDAQFAYPNHFEISRPHSFLYREPIIEKMEENTELEKRPMDNMQVNFRSPGEDESGLAVMSLRSPTISWIFPRRGEYYDRFLTFQEALPEDLQSWKEALILFMKKLTYRYHRPLLMKSPAHTARIKILLDLFPEARFIHIHRNPFTVFQSTVKLYDTAVRGSNLQDAVPGSVNSGIIRRYKEMYDAFFEQKGLIPSGQIVEIAFDELERDKIGTLQKIYTHLDIPNLEAALPNLERYLKRTEDYKKNTFKPLAEPYRSEVIQTWQRNFEEWGYPIH